MGARPHGRGRVCGWHREHTFFSPADFLGDWRRGRRNLWHFPEGPSQRKRSCYRICGTWSAAFLHPVFHISLMWNVGKSFQVGSIGDAGSSTPAILALWVMSFNSPA